METNIGNSVYKPRFFEPFFTKLNGITIPFGDDQSAIELLIARKEYSFAYLRNGELRTLEAFNASGKIPFETFLNHVHLTISSDNIFKLGKYLSRVFRPARYGAHLDGLDIHINQTTDANKVDGLSIISLSLAKRLGWENAQVNSSSQFTLVYDKGLVKGNCVVSDKIKHDVIIYGNENIKEEIKFDGCYVALEPVGLSYHLRIDIQSMLNLWPLLGGAEIFLDWTYKAIEEFKDNLITGKVGSMLDDFNNKSIESIQAQKWTLRKAIYHKIPYNRFPGLMRLAWTMYKNSLISFAKDRSFHIPVPHGMRGYFRVDLRNHDNDGNFQSTVAKNTICLDNLGNIWINEADIENFLAVKGGADLDDNAGVIPIEDGKAIVFRNPNQYGEYGIHTIEYDGVEVKGFNKTFGKIPIKKIERIKEENSPTEQLNGLIIRFLNTHPENKQFIQYSVENLIRAFAKIANNAANIGLVANAEMSRSAIGITHKSLMKDLMEQYRWNLERVIDSTVKEGISASEDIEQTRNMYESIIEKNISLPKTLLPRVPQKYRELMKVEANHPLDQLVEAIKYLVKKVDLDLLGEGSISKGNRTKGFIDHLDIPFLQIGSDTNSPMRDTAANLLKKYNRSMAILLDKTKDSLDREAERKSGIDEMQKDFAGIFADFSKEEKLELVKCWAFNIYKTEKAVHDSVLWIKGISDSTIEMLCNCGIGYHIEQLKTNCNVVSIKTGENRHPVIRYKEEKTNELKGFSFRIWSSTIKEIAAEEYSDAFNVIIKDRKCLLDSEEFNIGDECKVEDGNYLITSLTQAFSKKNGYPLRGSLRIYISR
jgi:hypothetical protein